MIPSTASPFSCSVSNGSFQMFWNSISKSLMNSQTRCFSSLFLNFPFWASLINLVKPQ